MFRDYYGIFVLGDLAGVFTSKEDEKIEQGLEPELVVKVNARNESEAMVLILNSEEYTDYQEKTIRERMDLEEIYMCDKDGWKCSSR